MKFKLKTIVTVFLIAAVTAASGGSLEKNKTYKIGDRGPAGGLIFYDNGSDLKGWRYLEAAPTDQSEAAAWSDGNTPITGAVDIAIGAGALNTKKIIKTQGNGTYAAKICSDYKGGGKNDWYLPSKKELELLYGNLKKKGIGGFADSEYWSSSESSEPYAWYQGFGDGAIDNNTKTNRLYVRAVRAFKL